MKRIAAMILAAIAFAALFTLVHKTDGLEANPAKPEPQASPESGEPVAPDEPDFDFTEMNQTVQAAYLYKLAARPSEFDGKLLRLPGQFATTLDETTGKRYFGCVVGGPGGGCPCCSQTLLFEFEPKEAELWRTNYPPEKTSITITGRLKMVKETSYGQTFDIPRIIDCDVAVSTAD